MVITDCVDTWYMVPTWLACQPTVSRLCNSSLYWFHSSVICRRISEQCHFHSSFHTHTETRMLESPCVSTVDTASFRLCRDAFIARFFRLSVIVYTHRSLSRFSTSWNIDTFTIGSFSFRFFIYVLGWLPFSPDWRPITAIWPFIYCPFVTTNVSTGVFTVLVSKHVFCYGSELTSTSFSQTILYKFCWFCSATTHFDS